MIIGLSNNVSFLGEHLFNRFLREISPSEGSIFVGMGDECRFEPQDENAMNSTYIYMEHPSRTLAQCNPREYLYQASIKPIKVALRMRELGYKQFLYTGSYWQEPFGNGFSFMNLYATSKEITQQLLKGIQTDDYKIRILHLFDLTCEKDKRDKFLAKLFVRDIESKDINLNNPSNYVSPVHIEDQITAILRLCTDVSKNKFEVLAFPGERRFQIGELQALIWNKHVDLSNNFVEIDSTTRHFVPSWWKPRPLFDLENYKNAEK